MNSSKRSGPAYGFKVNSLNILLDAKSSDKKITLLKYIVQESIAKKFRYLLNVEQEIDSLNNAAKISLQNLLAEFKELEKGMNLIQKEHEHPVIKTFLQESLIVFKDLKTEANSTQSLYKNCLVYFGDSTTALDSKDFFSLLLKFFKVYQSYANDVKTSPKASKESLTT